MTQGNDSILLRVTGNGAQDTVIWASELARKLTYFNPSGRKLSDVFSGYFSDDNSDLKSGAFVNVEGANFVANIMNIGLDGCLVVSLFPVSGYYDEIVDTESDTEDEISKKTLALRLAVRDLELNRKKLKNTNEIAGMGSFEYISDQHCLVLTPEACKVLGINDATTVVSSDFICSKVKNGKLSGMCDAIMSSNMKARFETEIVVVDDSSNERDIKVVMQKLSPDDNILDGVFMDISAIKNTERELKKQDTYFRRMFEKANIGIFTVDSSGHMLSCNPFIMELTGYSQSELSSANCAELIVHPDDKTSIKNIFRKVIDTSVSSAPFEMRIVVKEGEVINVLVSFEFVKPDSSEPLVFGFLSDISEYKKMQVINIEQERMLLQQSKMATMGEMMGIIAHQWMQPLNAIAMVAQMLQELVDVDEENEKLIRKTVSSILDQINFMTATANDFRKFLKPSEEMSVFSPVKAVENVLSMYRPQLKYNDVKCGMFFDSDEAKKAMVVGYENEFKNVIMNLCINARDAMEQNNTEDAEIEIFFEKKNDKIVISVFDNGGGIPEHIMEKIFNAYVSSKGEKGTGLGLYMSKLIIKERMNGDISASNSERGAVISITLDDVAEKSETY